jgi:hypothetical protein
MFFRQGVLATRLGLVAGLAALLFAGCGSDDDGRALGPDSGQVGPRSPWMGSRSPG